MSSSTSSASLGSARAIPSSPRVSFIPIPNDDLPRSSQKPLFRFIVPSFHFFSIMRHSSFFSFRWRRICYNPPMSASRNFPITKVMGIAQDTFLPFLTLEERAKLSMTSTEMNRLTVPSLKEALITKIKEIHTMFKGLVFFNVLDESCFFDVHFLGTTLKQMINEIKQHPLLGELFLSQKGDLKKVLKAFKDIQDEDLLKCCERHMPEDIFAELNQNYPNLTQRASIARRWLEENHRNTAPFNNTSEINLSGLDLRTFPIEFISYFNLVTGLSLIANQIRYIPLEINRFTELRELLCERNQIQRIPRIILKHLVWLHLLSNQIKEFEIESGDLPSLERLDLALNNFEIIPRIDKLRQLRSISIYGNPMDTDALNLNLSRENLEVVRKFSMKRWISKHKWALGAVVGLTSLCTIIWMKYLKKR